MCECVQECVCVFERERERGRERARERERERESPRLGETLKKSTQVFEVIVTEE